MISKYSTALKQFSKNKKSLFVHVKSLNLKPFISLIGSIIY